MPSMSLQTGMLLALVTIASPAVAQSTLQKPTCDAAAIKSLEDKVSAIPDGRQKGTAASEVAAAKDRLGKGQIEECQEHLLRANVQTK